MVAVLYFSTVACEPYVTINISTKEKPSIFYHIASGLISAVLNWKLSDWEALKRSLIICCATVVSYLGATSEYLTAGEWFYVVVHYIPILGQLISIGHIIQYYFGPSVSEYFLVVTQDSNNQKQPTSNADDRPKGFSNSFNDHMLVFSLCAGIFLSAVALVLYFITRPV